jgi:SAM-dependent methyltransferase
MKTVVSVQDLLEQEIKPDALLEEYVRMVDASIAERWAGAGLEQAPCPGCGATSSRAAFDRHGMSYRVCADCESLYVSPRPAEAELSDYYRHGPAGRFWRDRIIPATTSVRLEKLVQPRADWVLDGIAEYAPEAARLVDLSPHGGPLLQAILAGSSTIQTAVAANATADLDHPAPRAPIQVMPLPLSDLPGAGPADVVLAFDAFDRSADVAALAAGIHEMLRPGGLLFLTAPCASGFELQVLWDRSPAIVPPDKMNLLSADGWARRFAAPAWELVEFSTPGMFDVENVRRAIAAEPEGPWPRFIRTLVQQPETGRLEFQAYLQQFRLASFARLIVRRTREAA